MPTSRSSVGAVSGTGGDREPLIAAYEGIVCDLDGVVYRGSDAVPGAAGALQRLVTDGIGLVYATNNASRVPAEVATQLSRLGAPGGVHRVVTSAEAGAARLRASLDPGAGVLALGGDGVVLALREAGLVPVAPDGARVPGDGVVAVLQGFGRALTVLDYEIAARHLRSGCTWVATNDDATLPLEWGSAPGNGAYVDLLVGAVGRRPDVVGKPHAPLYELALSRLGLGASRALAVGDRLGTDIAGAEAAGLPSAWVLTGVEPPSALLRSPEARPTYVIGGLSELLEPYAVPRRDGSAWVCGRARARVDDDGLTAGGGGSGIETVRASLAAVLEHLESRDESHDDVHDRAVLHAACHRLDEAFAAAGDTPARA